MLQLLPAYMWVPPQEENRAGLLDVQHSSSGCLRDCLVPFLHACVPAQMLGTCCRLPNSIFHCTTSLGEGGKILELRTDTAAWQF